MVKRRDIPGVDNVEELRRRYELRADTDKYAERTKLTKLIIKGDEGLILKRISITDSSGKISSVIMPVNKMVIVEGLALGSYTITDELNRNSINVDIGYYGTYEVVLGSYKILGIRIDQSNSDPSGCVTYIDEAVGMTPGSEEFDSFFGYKPCLFKDGKVVCYLNKNNFTKDEDGNSVDITSGNAGDVMIEFPRHDISIVTSGNILDVKITDNPNASGFTCYAHSRGNVTKDKFYLGAYYSCLISGKLKSLSGKIPQASCDITTWRNYARANGDGYDVFAFYQLTYIQALYLIKYKNLNSVQSIGMGTNNTRTTTGVTNIFGMCYGTSSNSVRMKLFGIEDLWGNFYNVLDGLYFDSSYNMKTATTNFNTSLTGYSTAGNIGSISGNIKSVMGTDLAGFLIKTAGASSSTHFCSAGTTDTNKYPLMPICRGESGGGIFSSELYATTNYNTAAARLMYL